MNNKRVMAIDYGNARTGVAFSDLTWTLPGETLTIHERDINSLISAVAELARSRNADIIALGCPLNEDGSAGTQYRKTDALKRKLEALGFDVRFVDERFTSIEAWELLTPRERRTRDKSRLDEVSAAIILQDFLNTFYDKRVGQMKPTL